MFRAPSPAWGGFSTSEASRIAPAHVPNVGFAFTNCLSFSKPSAPRSLRNGTGLAARDYEAFDEVQLLWLFDEHNFDAKLFEPAAVCVEITL